MNEDAFHKLVAALKEAGYRVKTSTPEHSYLFAHVTGNDIVAGFCTVNNGMSYTYIDGAISADHARCFDKYSKCPLRLPLPETDEQLAYVMEQLVYWASDEGYKKSNSYDFDSWVTEYPKEMAHADVQ